MRVWIVVLLIMAIAAIGLHADRLMTVLVALAAVLIIFASFIGNAILME